MSYFGRSSECMPYLGMFDAHNGYLFATMSILGFGTVVQYRNPKSRTPGMIRVRSEDPHMTCAIRTHAMTLINHELTPSSSDDSCRQLRVVLRSGGPTGVLEPYANTVERRSARNGKHPKVTCPSHDTQVRRNIYLIQYCTLYLAMYTLFDARVCITRSQQSRKLLTTMSWFLNRHFGGKGRKKKISYATIIFTPLAFSQRTPRGSARGGDDTGNLGFANTSVAKPVQHLSCFAKSQLVDIYT